MKTRVVFATIIVSALVFIGMFLSAPFAGAQTPTPTPEYCTYRFNFDEDVEGWTAYDGSGSGPTWESPGYLVGNGDPYIYFQSPPLPSIFSGTGVDLRYRLGAAYGLPNGGLRCMDDGSNISGPNAANITYSPNNVTCNDVRLYIQHYVLKKSDYIWIERTNGTCTPGTATPTPEPTATPTPAGCTIPENGTFDDDSAWAGDSGWWQSGAANLNITSVPLSQIFTVPLTMTNPTLSFDARGESTEFFPVPAVYYFIDNQTDGESVSFTQSITSTYQTFLVDLSDYAGKQISLGFSDYYGDNITIDNVCVDDGTTAYGSCIAPTNGTFDTNTTGWDLYRGANYNSPSQAVYLPFSGAGETESGAATSQNSYELPSTSNGEYLIYQYTSRAVQDTGITMAGVWTPDQASEFYSYVEVYPQDYIYQFDISTLAGQTVELGVNNPGFDPLTGTTKEGDVIVDNICILLSTTPPQLPSPTNPNQYIPATLGDWYSCSDVESMVWNYVGVDLRYHRINYAAGASVWDPIGWVPWLISALWVIFSTLICFLLMLVQTIINLIEYLINNILNIFNWFLNNWDQLPALATAWLLAGLNSFANFAAVAWQSTKNLAEWFGEAMWELIYSIPELVLNMGTLADWIGASIIWLWEAIIIFGNWLIANGWNFIIWLYNNMGGLLQLLFLSLAGPFGSLIYIIILIWNNLAIFLTWLAGLLGYETLPEAISNTLLAIFWLFSASFKYLYAYLVDTAAAPQAMLTALMEGVQASSFGALLGCDGNGSFWCGFLTGLDIVNISYGHTIFYPIVIVTITVATLFVLKREFARLLWTVLDYVFRI